MKIRLKFSFLFLKNHIPPHISLSFSHFPQTIFSPLLFLLPLLPSPPKRLIFNSWTKYKRDTTHLEQDGHIQKDGKPILEHFVDWGFISFQLEICLIGLFVFVVGLLLLGGVVVVIQSLFSLFSFLFSLSLSLFSLFLFSLSFSFLFSLFLPPLSSRPTRNFPDRTVCFCYGIAVARWNSGCDPKFVQRNT